MDRLTEAGDTPQEPHEVLCSGLSFLIHGAVRSAQLGQEVRLAFPAGPDDRSARGNGWRESSQNDWRLLRQSTFELNLTFI